MGLNFIRAKAEHFRQMRDEAFNEELSTPDLLTRLRTDVLIHLFHCQLNDQLAELTPGLCLVARAFSDSDVRLLQRGKFVASVLPGDAELLTTLMRKNYHHGVISVIIDSVPGFDQVFKVRSKRPFRNT